METKNLKCVIFWRKAWNEYRTLDRDLVSTPATKEAFWNRRRRKHEKIRLADERYIREMKAFHG